MTSETQISSVNGFTEILMWNQTRLTYLTELLVEHHHVEKRASTRWKSEGWETIRAEFNTRFGLNVTIKQLKDRVQVMKNDYVVIKNISNTSGFDFNPMLKNFVATDDVWDAYIQKHPEARIWRGVAIPLYNEWYEMFERTIADGSRQRNTLAPTETIELNDPYMTPPHETHVVLTKDDGSLASSLDVKHKMGKEPVNLVDKKKRRSSKEPSSTFAEAMVEATKELKKTSIPPYKMIQQCVKLIMVMDLTISEKARAADLIRKDNAYLVFLKFDEATRLEWLKMHFGDL